MRHVAAMGVVLVVLGGCALAERLTGTRSGPRAPVTGPSASPAAPLTPAALDTTTEAERRAALRQAGDTVGRELGVTVASLGAPSEPGFWIRTPLTDAPGKGRIEDAATGRSVAVDLIPLDGPRGAGSRLSLAAFRTLGLALTDLPELRVYRLAD